MPHTSTLDYSKLPSYKPLFLDYLNNFDALSPFFAADPFDAAAWGDVAAKLEGKSATADPLRKLNVSLGADEATLASLDALGEGALAVVSGQQVGIFGGPLYTIAKALTAVRLARLAEQRLGRRVVPLFWMDADDHDFAEVQKTSILTRGNELLDLRYEPPGAPGRHSVGRLVLAPEISAVIDKAGEVLTDSEFKEDVLASLRSSYAPGRSMAEAFGAWMLRMTRGTGLAVIDPTLPELKAMGAALFERELEERSKSSAIVNKTSEELVARGYHVQASPADGQLNLFYAHPDRAAIGVSDGGMRLAADGATVSKEDVVQQLRDEPGRFSPNVLLRPIYQDTLFPTLAYVAGPSELAYFAQIRGLYEHFGVVMPLIASRASFTVVERAPARFLERYDVPFVELKSNDEAILNSIVRQHTPPQLDEDLTRARNCIEDITSALERDLAPVDKSLVPTVQSTRGKLLHHLKELESKALRAVKRKNETVRQQFLAARTALFPGFAFQERRLSALGFLAKYGWHFTTMIEESVDPQSKAHTLFYP